MFMLDKLSKKFTVIVDGMKISINKNHAKRMQVGDVLQKHAYFLFFLKTCKEQMTLLHEYTKDAKFEFGEAKQTFVREIMKLGDSGEDAPEKNYFLNCVMDFVLLSKYRLIMTQEWYKYEPTSVSLCKSVRSHDLKALKKSSKEGLGTEFRVTKNVQVIKIYLGNKPIDRYEFNPTTKNNK